MKTCKTLTIIIILGLCLPALAGENALKVKPANPKRGDPVVLTYSPEKSSTGLKGSRSVTAHILFVSEGMTDVLDKEMIRKSRIWKVTFQVTEKASLILVRFTSENKTDDNNGDCWSIPVYGEDKKPLRNAYHLLASLHQLEEFKGFRMDKSKEAMNKYIEFELVNYPDNINAYSSKWSQMMSRYKGSDSIRNVIKKEVLMLYKSVKPDEKTIYTLLTWFNQTGMMKEGKAIKDSIVNANPRGYIAFQDKFISVLMNPDPSAEAAEKILADFPDMESSNKTILMNVLISSYTRLGEFGKVEELISKTEIKNGMMYNEIAWPMIEKGKNLEKATAWASRGVELLRKQKADQKNASANQVKNIGNSLGMVLDTYGYGLEQLGKTAEAMKAYTEAFELTEGMQEDINTRYVQLLTKNGDYTKAVETAEACILKEKANDKIAEAYKEAFRQVHGSSAGAVEKLNKLAGDAKARMMEKLKNEMLNQPAPDFNLKDFDGNYVKLSDLKGKVVVVDFWATWCGPCKMSFPALQKVYEKYASNPAIQILALDTWEREKTAAEKEKKVKDFIAENKYTFKVLFDEGEVVGKYGVTGIPTKFIIDKNGIMQFKTIGFNGEKKMITEMEAAFELLLSK